MKDRRVARPVGRPVGRADRWRGLPGPRPVRQLVRRSAGVCLAALVAGSSGVACTQAATSLDRRSTEDAVERAVAGRFDLEIESVTCPADIPRGEGRQVRCEVAFVDDVGPVRVDVTQTDDAGGLEVEPLDTVVDPRNVGAELMDRLARQFGHPFLADCGDPGPRVVSPGDVLECATESEDGPQVVRAEVVDVAGSLRFEIQP